MGYRWHFWSDWWGYAGGGLVDVERAPKRTYAAFRDASRPVLVTARTDRSVVRAGRGRRSRCSSSTTPHEPWTRRPCEWEVRDATSAVIAPDPEGFRIGLAVPDDGVLVAVPALDRRVRRRRDRSRSTPPPERSTPIGEVAVDARARATARTVTFRWDDETNFVHLHCPQPDAEYPPGLQRGRMTRTLGNGDVELELGTGDVDRALARLRRRARPVPRRRRLPRVGADRRAAARGGSRPRAPAPGPAGPTPTAGLARAAAPGRRRRRSRSRPATARDRRRGARLVAARRARSTPTHRRASSSTATTRGRTPACADDDGAGPTRTGARRCTTRRAARSRSRR